MPEIIELLQPTNYWTFSFWLIVLFLILLKSNKFETKWFSLDFRKAKVDVNELECELLLKDRLLKDFKILRISLSSKLDSLIICFRSNFRKNFIEYMETLKPEDDPDYNVCLENHASLKAYEKLIELALKTIAAPMITDMFFRNGFPQLPYNTTDNREYERLSGSFDAAIIRKFHTVLRATELYVDSEWFDDGIDSDAIKDYFNYNEELKTDCVKETILFFRTMITERDEFITQIRVDFPKMFKKDEECQKFCELYFRELHE
ncbi:MAG: hypothetical protein ACOCP4_06410 [Candidatus Woesearchaeota archaeon]